MDDYDEDDDDGDVDDKHLFHKKPLLFLLLNHCKPEKSENGVDENNCANIGLIVYWYTGYADRQNIYNYVFSPRICDAFFSP